MKQLNNKLISFREYLTKLKEIVGNFPDIFVIMDAVFTQTDSWVPPSGDRITDVVKTLLETSEENREDLESLVKRIRKLEIEVEILKKRRFGVGEIGAGEFVNIILPEHQ